MDNADDEEVFFKPFISRNPLLHTGMTRRLCDILPEKPNCAILYTSRHRTCAQELLKRTQSSKVMEVPMMSMEDSVRLLKNELGIPEDPEALPTDEPSMQRLVEVLGNLPLAITQAASFMRVNNLTPELYTTLYNDMETEQETFLREEFVDWRRDSDMPNAVLLTWKLSFEQIRGKNELAAKVLSILSVLDRHGVLDWMFPYFPGATRLQVLMAIALLKSFSFVTRQDNAMHRLVQVATRAWIGPEAWQSAVQDALRFLCNVFAGLNSNDWASRQLSDYTIRRSLEYYPHTKSVLAALSTVENEDLTRSTINGFFEEWGTEGLASESFAKKANEVYQEVIRGDYRSLTDMIRFVRALSGGSMRYFVKLYRGPYESTDRYDRSFSDSKDSEYDHTPLSWAAQYGDETVVKLLLETGKVDVNSRDSDLGRTPLSRAAQYGREVVVKLLLESGKVDVDSRDLKDGRTPLSWAAKNGHEPVVKLLLKTGKVDVDLRHSWHGRTPLSWAAENGHEAVVKLLLETGEVDVDLRDSYNTQTPLSWAAEYGHEVVVKLLLETGKVDVNLKSNGGWTPLSLAARNGHEEVVKLLLKTGKVDADLRYSWCGRTPLSWAAAYGHKAVVKLLVERDDVEADSKDQDGRTPLSYAAERGHEAVVRLLVERDDVEADSKDKDGRTPLSWAIELGHNAVVMLLETKLRNWRVG
jgi:ankyrin repeat protein